MKRQIAIYCLYALVLLALLAGCGGGAEIDPPAGTAPRINPPVELPVALDAWPALSDRHAGVPAEYELVAESECLRLYLKEATSALIVEDKRNGRLWHSSPADLAEVKVSQAWRGRIESPILLGYTDADRGRAKVAKPEDMEIDLAPVEGGVHATYRFPKEGFELAVIYTVDDDFLQVTIPEAEIVESNQENTLISLDVLSFFGATHDGQGGYIVFPDGSGAIMSYTSPHPEAVQEISLSVYGEDQFTFEASDVYREPAPMPVFGLVSEEPLLPDHNPAGDKAAFVAFITQGDFDARLAVGRSGKTIPYNHAWVTFVYRRQGEFSLTGGQPAWLYEPDLVGSDRQVRYCFLGEKDADYARIGSRYRDFLIHERGAQRIGDDAPLTHLLFYMGTERRTWFLRDLIQMTTFAQAREILAALGESGVSRADVILVSWSRGEIAGRYPQRLPVEKQLGGADDLRALINQASARGQRLFLADDYLVALPGGRGVFPFSDAIRGVDGLPVGQGGTYFINPQVSLRRFATRDVPRMAELGADGLWLQNFAGVAVPDTNDRYPLSREGFAASWMQIADLARQQFGAVAMTGGNSYAIPYADVLSFVPTDSTHYDLFDETVPFYQIVAHGLVSYSGVPYNLLNDGQRTFLHQVEYGTVPSFVLTQASSALLYRTQASDLYSTQYDFWRDKVVRQYQAMEKLAPLINQFIADHTRLAEGVYQTTYEGGTRVVVNYNEQPYVVESVPVPAMDFAVLRGEN
jgi:hypothetical protein